MATLHLTQYRVDTLKPRKVILDVRDTELKGFGAFGRQTLTGESGRPSTTAAAANRFAPILSVIMQKAESRGCRGLTGVAMESHIAGYLAIWRRLHHRSDAQGCVAA